MSGRPKKGLSSKDEPIFLEFLGLFGLENWDDRAHFWTQDDLINGETIKDYVELRPHLMKLSYPKNAVRKIQDENFNVKDLITLLGQFAKLYGYKIVSYTKEIKPCRKNGLTKKKCYQVYNLQPLPSTELGFNDEADQF
jgi:hypothetical protein